MAFEADKVIVSLIADVEGFDRTVKQSATSFDSSMNKIAASATKAEVSAAGFGKSTGRAASDISRYSRTMERDFVNLGNVLSGSSSPFVVPVKQAPAVASAMRLVGTGASVLGGIMGGVLVGAVFAAAAALTEFIFKGDDAADKIKGLVEKLKENAEKAQLAATAQGIYDRSVEGSIAKVEKLTKALREQNLTLEDTINLNKAAAAVALGTVATNISAVSGKLAAEADRLKRAQEWLANVQSGRGLGENPAATLLAAEAGVEASEKRVLDLTNQLNNLSVAANNGARALKAMDFPLLEREAKEAVDPIAGINRYFDDMAKKAKAAGTYTRELAKEIEKLRAAELKEARARPKPVDGDLSRFVSPISGGARISGQYGEQRSSGRHQGVDLAAPVGTNVNAAAAGTVITAGTLPGYGNVLIIDHGRGTTTRYAHLSKFLVGQGAQVGAGQVIALSGGAKGAPGAGNSKGPHLHFEVREGGRSVNPGSGQYPTDSASVRVPSAATGKQNIFKEQSDRLNQTLLEAQAALGQGIEQQAEIAKLQVLSDAKRLSLGLDRDVKEGALTQAEAEKLKATIYLITLAKQDAIEREKQLRLNQARFALEDQERQFAIDDLQFAEEMARSQAGQRAVQLQILDAMIEQKRLQLEEAKNLAIRNGATKDEIAAIQAKINRLPNERARGAARVERGTMGPLESFLNGLPQSAAESNEALEQLAVGGIQSVANGLAQAGNEWIKLGGIAGRVINEIIGQLIRLAFYQALAGLFGKSSRAIIPGGLSDGSNALYGDPFASAKGNVFSGGAPVPFAAGGIISRPTVFPMANGGIGLAGEAGSEAIMPLGRDSQGRLGVRISNARAASPGMGGQATVLVAIQSSEFFEGKIMQVTGPVIAQASISAAQGGAAMARNGLARKSLHTLG